MPDDDPIARARAVLEAATPGPWEIEREELPADCWVDAGPGFPIRIGPIAVWEPEVLDVRRNEADARAIALLGSVWPELLDVVELVPGPGSCASGLQGCVCDVCLAIEAVDVLRAKLAELV